MKFLEECEKEYDKIRHGEGMPTRSLDFNFASAYVVLQRVRKRIKSMPFYGDRDMGLILISKSDLLKSLE
jgi:hypothetical protein